MAKARLADGPESELPEIQAWANRQSGLSAVRDSTAAVLIVAEALHEKAAYDVRELTETLAAGIGSV